MFTKKIVLMVAVLGSMAIGCGVDAPEMRHEGPGGAPPCENPRPCEMGWEGHPTFACDGLETEWFAVVLIETMVAYVRQCPAVQ